MILHHIKALAKDSAIYALGNIASKVVGFILLPFYVDKLSAVEYGMLGTLEAAFQMIVTLAGLNLYVAFVRWYADKELQGRQQSTFFTLLAVIMFIAVAVNILFFPFAGNISGLLFDSDEHIRLVRLMFCSAGLDLVGTLPSTLCRVQLNPAQYTRNIMIRLCVVLCVTILLLTVFDRKLEGIYEAQIVGGITYLLLFLPYIIKNIKIKFEQKILGKLFHYSLPLTMSSSFGILLTVADRFSLNFISGLVSVGVYSLGFKLANVLKTIIVQPISMSIPPLVFRMADQPEGKRFYAKLMTWLTILIVFPAAGISIFGQETVKVLTIGKPDYWDAWMVIPFIAFGTVFGMLKDQTSYILQIVNKTGVIASIIVVVSLLNLGLNLLLIPFMGAIGAGLSMLLSQMIYFAAMLHYVRRYYPVRYEYRKIFLSICLGVACCLIAYLIRNWGLGWRLTVKTFLLAGYPFLLYRFRFYDRDELLALRGLWQKWRNPGMWKENVQKTKWQAE